MKNILLILVATLAIACSSSKGTANLDNKKSESSSTATTTPKIKDEAGQTKKQDVDSIVVREEAVKIVEKRGESTGTYHIIIGSFKVLENAQKLCHEVVEEGYLPSIMENDEGLYRVAIYTGDEEAARRKLTELKDENKYEGIWLLREK